MKLTFLVVLIFLVLYWLFGEVNDSDKFNAKFSCGFMEQFVEVFEMDVICNKSFNDNKINRIEYWSITWKFETIETIWKENMQSGEGRPDLVVNSTKPIPQRFFNVDDYLVIPGLDEIIKKREQRNDSKSDVTKPENK